MVTKTDAAYLAGLIDGEGYIGIKKTTIKKGNASRGYHARIQVRMVDEPAIAFLARHARRELLPGAPGDGLQRSPG